MIDRKTPALPQEGPVGLLADRLGETTAARVGELRRRRRAVVLPLTIAFMAWYLAYALTAVYAPSFMATPVFGNVNLGLLLGFAQTFSTFAVAGYYTRYARRRLDPLAEEIRRHVEGTTS